MNSLKRAMPTILQISSGVFGVLSAAGVPGAGIVQAGLSMLSGYVEEKTFKKSFRKLEHAFEENSSKLEAIGEQLASQREAISQILNLVIENRYKKGIERIEGAYDTLMKGSHDLKSTMREMEGFIYELNTENSTSLNIKTIRSYLDMINKEKGQQAVRELCSYVVTVKAEYLIMVSLYYTYKEDQKRVADEWTDFNTQAKEIIKIGGLDEVDMMEQLKQLSLEMPSTENEKTRSQRQNSSEGEVHQNKSSERRQY